MTALRVDRLTVTYGAVVALDSVSIEVGDDELVAVLGANGAGKSTLLKTVSGLVRPSSGTVTVRASDVTAADAESIARMGVAHVPEGRRIFPTLTVEQNLLVGTVSRQGRDGMDADFERVYGLFPALSERRTQQGWSLSGGEQQMLAIGRALMSRPRLLMLDEPSLGLAPMLVGQMLRVVRGICDAGTSVLLVEQNARAALRVADRACVLRGGHVVRTGPAAELQARDDIRRTYLGA